MQSSMSAWLKLLQMRELQARLQFQLIWLDEELILF